ncbi:hypothetical protein [Pannonibacter carbonis]|uniref:hypothetical protein n=1 Tax=Pannonibacter carbonis TaxID=2067569 RepID=UPI000D0F4FF7|nr:hypothetical protein [Pannonibacter carbonis]
MKIEKINSPKHASDAYSLAGIAALLAVAIVTVIASAALAFAQMPANAGSMTKGNRLSSELPMSCKGQTWGNWNASCLESLSGKAGLRMVGATTAADQPVANTTVLVRQAPAG